MGARIACVLVIACAIGCGSPSRTPVDASDEPTPDAPAEPAAFGEACSKHTDCGTGFCVEPVGNTGGVCTRTCDAEECPTGWECRNVDLPQIDLDLCVPAAQHLCLACVNDAECGGGACLDIDGGGRCATPCSDLCPVGYTCAADASGTHTGTFCQPVTNSCTCSDGMQDATRSCSSMNSIGTCFGTQTCDAATGWSACTAITPAPETCDGVDSDCNFIIDDGVGGGAACTIDNGFGSCPGVETCEGSAGFVCAGQTPMMEACNFADDDCDTKVDEGYVGLGASCTAGIGACTRYGSQRCNSAGDGLVCSAVAGAPGTEACNQVDDDCDTSTDENFKVGANALGTQCVAGLGVCARYGTYVCRGDGAGTQCSAVAGTNASTETCNYLDDNCDGAVDNGFRNAATGFYDTDQHCGSCGNDCTTLYTAQNAYGACAVGASAQCEMRCDTGTGNLNGSTFDGCEFTLDAAAIYVSVTDPTAIDDATCGLGPTGTGTGNHPCKTITAGLARSITTGRTKVLVADGTYGEGVTLVSGKNLLGGYRADTWERHLTTTSTVIAGATEVGNHDRTVTASAITSATLFEGFVVRGSFNTKPSGNSYAIWVSSSNASLTIRDNKIFAGRGGPGLAGMPGTNGLAGGNGGGRASGGNDANYDARSVSGCSGDIAIFAVRGYDNGGFRRCDGVLVSGGHGGGNLCPPSSAANSNNPPPSEQSGRDGLNGLSAAGGGSAGTGNDAGDDGYVYNDARRCIVPAAPSFGLDGNSGAPGSAASAVPGCSSATGAVSGDDWVGGAGAAGNSGTPGGGGGGGGAGGGGYCADCRNGPQTGGDHRIGGHGGGGGAGGCGGAGGAGGEPGGGVFGIFITGGSAPTITNNEIARGEGGSGGNGGIGGAGGIGGNGGAGGQSELFCTDKAGRGGDGGTGGQGSGGGGGCGGSSFGIFTSGVGTPNYCASNTVSGGSAGGGGAGGFSGGNSGGSGATGVLQDCTSL